LKVKVPKVIQIGSHSYNVFFDEVQADQGNGGSISYKRHRIYLAPGLHPDELRISFLH